jgi:hypothetical protein
VLKGVIKLIDVNYLAILIAAILSMVAGFIYYHPAVLGKPWMKAAGYTPASLKTDQKKMGKYYGLSFVLALVTAYVLAHVMAMSQSYFGNPMIQTGLMTAFWSWLGFVMPVQATGEIFGNKNWTLFALNTGYQLVALLLMGLVLGFMG